MKKVIIVGGVAGGMSCATRLRRLMEEAEITVFEKGPYVSFANCGLPYHVSGEIENREQLLVQTAENLKKRFAIDVRPNHEVLAIDRKAKTVTVKNQEQVFTQDYDVLVLSPGAKPVVPNFPGLAEAQNVYTVRSVPDIDRIMEHLQQQAIQHVTVVGAGFIGLEMVENLAKRQLQVTLIEKAPQVLPALDPEMAVFVEEELVKNGVNVLTNQGVAAFSEKGREVVLEDGQVLISDLTILAIGVQPESRLAKEAGLTLGLREAIVVDENYRTSDPNIYAIGDAILVTQHTSKEQSLISLASPANRQGRQVADIIAGLPRKNRGSLGTAIVRTFAMTAAFTGLNEHTLKRLGKNYQVVHTLGKHHASYYPNATDILLKLLFDPKTGEIFGAQAVGENGIDKRIDVLATAIKAGLTVEDLPELELTYAPPFGSAKDPVNMIGYAALNLMEGLSENVQWYDLANELKNGAQLLDVRNPAELSNGKFTNALAIPLDELRARLVELDKNQAYIVSCHSGQRSYLAERILKQHGFKVKNLDGAYYLYSHVHK